MDNLSRVLKVNDLLCIGFVTKNLACIRFEGLWVKLIYTYKSLLGSYKTFELLIQLNHVTIVYIVFDIIIQNCRYFFYLIFLFLVLVEVCCFYPLIYKISLIWILNK